jgi:hypothetical protein
MTTPSAFGRPELHAFLFASVDDEKNDGLTVLSALTRLGFDPWQEAARLSALSQDAAARALVTTFAPLPDSDWKAAQATAVAARLVGYLPSGPAAPRVATSGAPRAGGRHPLPASVTSRPTKWLFWAAIAVGWFFFMLYLTTPVSTSG